MTMTIMFRCPSRSSQSCFSFCQNGVKVVISSVKNDSQHDVDSVADHADWSLVLAEAYIASIMQSKHL